MPRSPGAKRVKRLIAEREASRGLLGKTVLADRYLFTALARDAAHGLDLDWLLHAYAGKFDPCSKPAVSSSPRRGARNRHRPIKRRR